MPGNPNWIEGVTEERAQGDGTWGLTVKGRDFREIFRRASGGFKGGDQVVSWGAYEDVCEHAGEFQPGQPNFLFLL